MYVHFDRHGHYAGRTQHFGCLGLLAVFFWISVLCAALAFPFIWPLVAFQSSSSGRDGLFAWSAETLWILVLLTGIVLLARRAQNVAQRRPRPPVSPPPVWLYEAAPEASGPRDWQVL